MTNISPEKKVEHNQYQRHCRTSNASLEKKADRNEYQRNYRTTNSSPEKRAKCNENQRNYRITNASPEKKAKCHENQRNCRTANASKKKKAQCNQYQRKYRASSLSMECTITKFHQTVNQGPLYVLTSCDQLWYRDNVTNADQIRQSIPDIIKYLNNRKSVDSKEWVCRTCHSHLVQNKVPPCTVANGMVFPEKPEFFDLNELEWRLPSPRIALQKLMEAPRGRQLMLHGNIVHVPANVTCTISMLPRLQSQTATIKVAIQKFSIVIKCWTT